MTCWFGESTDTERSALEIYSMSLKVEQAELNMRYRILDVVLVYCSRLGGVVICVLATGPKGCGFEPGQGDEFLRAINIRSTSFSRMGSKAGRSHVVRFYGM
jgi:hypothetical protein